MRWLKIDIFLTVMLLMTGCSIAGSWKIVSVKPPGAPFPIHRVIFDPHNNYTSTWTYKGETHTSTGRYRFDGNTLTVMQVYREPRIYRAQLRMDGTLELTYQEGSRKVSATLIKERKE